jgi:hypothetical protein
MALAGRSARRGGAGIRWITIGVAITLLVLLIDASLHSRSPAPEQQLATGTWIDRILPLIASSTVQGQTVARIWATGLKMPAPAVAQQINSVATGAYANYQSAIKLRPPLDLTGQAGLLDACLLARSQAAAQLKTALTSVLGAAAELGVSTASTLPSPSRSGSTTTPSTVSPPAAPPPAEIQAVQKAGTDIQVGDQAYQLFTGSLPGDLGIKMPASVWASNQGPYQPQQAQVFLTSLQNAAITAPVHQVKIFAVTTNPAPVSSQGATQIMPDASAMTVTVVVADTGNQTENNLTVTAAISPAGSGTSSVRDFLNLKPGQAYTIVGLGPLNPPQGSPVTLTVDVTSSSSASGSSGRTSLASYPLVFQMPAPPPPTTTTTVPRTSSTT